VLYLDGRAYPYERDERRALQIMTTFRERERERERETLELETKLNLQAYNSANRAARANLRPETRFRKLILYSIVSVNIG
jgi:hypothetical protein